MDSIFTAMETEMALLSNKVMRTEEQFFVILSESSIFEHEKDVGLIPNTADISQRRSNVLSQLRGTGTTTKEALKNAVASFDGGEIEIVEFVSEYAFAIKFISKKGSPTAFNEIQRLIEQIKPAHLEVRYIFTYRLWDEVQTVLIDWEGVKDNTWDWIRSFEPLLNLYILDGKVYYRSANNGNAYLIFEAEKPYARIKEVDL